MSQSQGLQQLDFMNPMSMIPPVRAATAGNISVQPIAESSSAASQHHVMSTPYGPAGVNPEVDGLDPLFFQQQVRFPGSILDPAMFKTPAYAQLSSQASRKNPPDNVSDKKGRKQTGASFQPAQDGLQSVQDMNTILPDTSSQDRAEDQSLSTPLNMDMDLDHFDITVFNNDFMGSWK